MSIEPVTPPIQPAKKGKRAVRLSIRTKIIFWAGLLLVLMALILIGYSVTTLRQISIENSTREASAIAEARANFLKGELDTPLVTARTLARSLGAIKEAGIPISLSRDEANGILRKVLMDNPSFLGTYTLWEPNAFDGLDSQYARAVANDETGRFIPYWVRDAEGIIHTEALTQYEVPGAGDWYILPRSTRKETTIAPIVHRIQSQDVVIASFIIPIVQDDVFYGIAGVDAPIGFVQQLVDDIDLYDGTTNAILFTDTGTLIAVHNQPELSNQPVSLIYEDFETIKPRLGTSFTRLSPDGTALQIFSPIPVNDGGTYWVLGLIIPFEKITAPATSAALRQVTISAGLIVLALIFLWIVASQIVRPVRTLTEAAEAVSKGDLTVTANVHSNDETGVLADAFNGMTRQLGSLIGSLEQRVAERTKALATSSEVSRRLSTILDQHQLLSEVVEQVKSAFNYYHAHIYLLDEANENLVMAGGTGEAGQTMLSRGHKIPVGKGLVGRAALTGKPVVVPDTLSDPSWLPNPLLPETKSEIAVPIMAGDQVLGVLDVQNNVAGSLGQQDVELLGSIANQLAVAMRNARIYQQAENSIEEARSLVALAPEAILMIDMETGLFADPNANAEKLYELPRDELVKVGPARMSPPRQPDGRDSNEKAMEKINEAMQGGNPDL